MELPVTYTLNAHQSDGVLYYTFPALERFEFVRHGISTRIGGVSEGVYASMNLGFSRGDKSGLVRENYRRFFGALGIPSEWAVDSDQAHHTHLRNVTRADRGKGVDLPKDYADIDGLLTDEPAVALVTKYADCVPLMFLDPKRRVIASSHAGWRGTVAGIGAVTVERMAADYGCRREDILVGIGPSIGPCCFEVDAPVFDEFRALSLFDDGCFRPGETDGKHIINLWEVNRRVLLSAGIRPDNITVTDLCTKCHPDVLWSHRVTGPQRGSLATVIAMTE